MLDWNAYYNMRNVLYKNPLNSFHKYSNRHVLVLEAIMPEQNKYKLFHNAELIRKASNELTGEMNKRYEQLMRTKKYRALKKLYDKYARAKDTEKLEDIKAQMAKMEKEYNVTWEYCRKTMIPIREKYGIDAVFGLTAAEDVWAGVKKCLYGNGEKLHFKSKDELPSIRAKQINRGIILKSDKNGGIFFTFNKMMIPVKIEDRFQRDEVTAILNYMANAEQLDKEAVESFLETGYLLNTYRPCYATIVCQKIRNKHHVYIHLTIEGKPFPKYNKDGTPRHPLGYGIVGCDIGTQSIAYTSNTEVGLKNLAERGNSIDRNERQEKLINRKLDRSRRANNPDNYNEDGTVKKGKKTWKKSKRYKKTLKRYRNKCRKSSINRHLAIDEELNHLRSLGDTFVTEPKNAAKLAKKAKKTTKNKNGKINRKKRYGKSIKNRCPGYFQAQAEKKFKYYVEVDNDYRASQYDHTADDYIKKKLSQRLYALTDGTIVQRDWYSSFLLYCCDILTGKLDKNKCRKLFDDKYALEIALIEFLKANNIKIKNSGIRIKAA